MIFSLRTSGPAAITTSGACGAFITDWKVSRVSSSEVGSRWVKSHSWSSRSEAEWETVPKKFDAGSLVSWSLITTSAQGELAGTEKRERRVLEEEAKICGEPSRGAEASRIVS